MTRPVRCPTRASAASAMLRALQGAMPCAVIRNADALFVGDFGDVDVVVPASADLMEVIRLLEVAARRLGWPAYRRVSGAHTAHLGVLAPTPALDSGEPPVIWIDVFRGLVWRGIHYLNADALLARSIELRGGVQCLRPEAAALATLLHYALYSQEVPVRYRSWLQDALPLSIDPRWCALLSVGEVQQVLDHARRGRWAAVRSWARVARRRLLVRSVRSSALEMSRFIGVQIARYVHAFFHPPGVLVVLEGPDPAAWMHGQALVHEVQRWHAFSVKDSLVAQPSLARMPRIWWTVLRGGLAALPLGRGRNRLPASALSVLTRAPCLSAAQPDSVRGIVAAAARAVGRATGVLADGRS